MKQTNGEVAPKDVCGKCGQRRVITGVAATVTCWCVGEVKAAPERIYVGAKAAAIPMNGVYTLSSHEGDVEYVRADIAKPDGEDVEVALKELREMFAGQDKFPPYITAGFDPNNNWQHLFVAHLVIEGVGWHFQGPTLSDVMSQVREWKEANQ